MSHFHPNILSPDPERRQRILPVLDAALDAVDPAAAVARVLQRSDEVLLVGEKQYRLSDYQRVFALAFGKAAAPMARSILGLGLHPDDGLVLTKYGHGPENPAAFAPLTLIEAGHPTPDANGVAAARRVAAIARSATADDLVILLISGGGSSLLTLPADDLTLADLKQTTRLLLACGATINEINAVRKHLSQVKGGQLARLAAPATVISLILSDVIGNPLDVIASGPAAPDPTTWADAWAVIEKYHLAADLPPAVRGRLQAGLAGAFPDTPKPGDPLFARVQNVIAGDNAIAAEAAQRAAASAGFDAAILSTFVQGEAREVARVLVGLGREVVAHRRPAAPPACLILGGETTVTLCGHGKGGRNQEMALAAAIDLAQTPDAAPIIIAALATDGTDGPTDAAGGLADAFSVARGEAAGLNAQTHLDDNNAWPWLKVTGDLLSTGPTRTNVNDLYFVFVLEPVMNFPAASW
jgi:hydroxypyruvate reductase